ncbi:uncharacterized protein FIBRA_07142 [Fibroporia radiculosa]|uniref:PPPDE domain-containing protein n=1 Tax=Fibroporia radiculosa TaxID=599839 RepID=J4GUE9_9APHY|nr:uncharacterized protein FIBRA_07142 [Fibroporia radiculosa]CCM04945.1 predicted protein [Fibroporia radiculosa]
MSNTVQIYVYDLSNGLSRQLSRQLTGKQLDGIWHTSVVVFGREIFYGQGILEASPGKSHHGKPLQIVDMGETAIDEDTFNEYLVEMRQHYTADKEPTSVPFVTYKVFAEFNCNSFTNDCVGFLTGGSIPAWIKDLPSDFLSTPFGAALRPTIDAMFRRPVPGQAPTAPILQPSPETTAAAISASPNPGLAASLLQSVTSQAFLPTSSDTSASTSSLTAPPSVSTSTVSAPIHICTNPSSLHALLRSHRAVVVFFTSATCGPCRMIEPAFEDLAYSKTHGSQQDRIAFVKVDMAVGLGGQVGAEYNIRATPTFTFFLDEKKVHELKGVNVTELRTQVDLLLYHAFPPHTHASLSLPSVESISTNPILFTQRPTINNIITKLDEFITSASPSPATIAAKDTLAHSFPLYLGARFPAADSKAAPPKNMNAGAHLLQTWADATCSIAKTLPAAKVFPLVDLWRLAVLDDSIGSWCATASSFTNPVEIFLGKAVQALDESQADARNCVLVTLRLLSNTFATTTLAKSLLSLSGGRSEITRMLVSSLLHKDAAVRTAAASLAFNVAAFLQKGRVDKLRGVGGEIEEDGDWETELVSAVLEAISNEVQSEEAVHRLTAALAFFLRLSPAYETQLVPLLEVLQARQTLEGKLLKGGCGEEGVQKKEVRKLIEEVARKLCT